LISGISLGHSRRSSGRTATNAKLLVVFIMRGDAANLLRSDFQQILLRGLNIAPLSNGTDFNFTLPLSRVGPASALYPDRIFAL
jgi:hypothetical protein